jgi:hypothetical protein
VFIFVVGAVSSQYVTVRKQRDTVSEEGWNSFFSNYDPKRIVVEKNDRSAFTKADYEAIENAPHVEKLIREDKYNMTQISDLLHFDSPQYFSTCFKAYTKMTPSEYKASIMK